MNNKDINKALELIEQYKENITTRPVDQINIPQNVIETLDQSKFNELDQKINSLKTDLTTDKTTLITIFGLFASIVAFLSVEIQVFKIICSTDKIAGITLILLSSLLLFILLIYIITKDWINADNKLRIKLNSPFTLLFVLIIIILIIGIGFLSRGNEELCKDNLIYQKYEIEFNDKTLLYDKKILELKTKNDELEKMIYQNTDKIDKINEKL